MGALLDAKVMMTIVSTSLGLEQYQMLRAQTRGNSDDSRGFRQDDCSSRPASWVLKRMRSLARSKAAAGIQARACTVVFGVKSS
jgi:hypothetical protein